MANKAVFNFEALDINMVTLKKITRAFGRNANLRSTLVLKSVLQEIYDTIITLLDSD